MAGIRISTWNINSVRLRPKLIEKFVNTRQPDILCLQEIKCAEEQFPEKFFRKLGFEHIAIHGQKAYHGVATVSKVPFGRTEKGFFAGKEDARHISTTVGDDVEIHNFYVPSGGDEPDRQKNEKFDHKLNFLTDAAAWFKKRKNKSKNKMILVGDLNIAPLENDVWSHKQLLRVVSHTPVEVDHLTALQGSHGWIDVVRQERPEPEKVFSWWSYRSPDYTKNNRGRRLDHIWCTSPLKDRLHSTDILTEARGWEKPSDHVPVSVTLELS